MQAKICLFLPKHTPVSWEQKTEKMGSRAGNCNLCSDFPMLENNKEKMAQFCSLQLSPEYGGVKTWGACTYQFFWTAKLTLVYKKTMCTMIMATKNEFQWYPIVWYEGKDWFVFTKTHTHFLRAEKREDGQQSWQLHTVQWFPNGEQQEENGPVL